MKIALTIVLTLAVAAGGVWLWGKWAGRAGAAGAQSELAVRVEPAVRGELVEGVSAPGIVQPKKKVSVSARVSARVMAITKEGDVVSEGDPSANPPKPASILVQLDDKDLRAALEALKQRKAAQEAQLQASQAQLLAQRATIAAAEATLADAQRELELQTDLLASKDVGQTTVDAAQTKVDELRAQIQASKSGLNAAEANVLAARHQIKAAEADVDKADQELTYAKIYAPFDAVVTKVNAEAGELVVTGTMNNAGTVILEVADLKNMVVEVKADETAVAHLTPGLRAHAHVGAFPDKTFEGKVYSVALQNTEDKDLTKYFKVVVDLDTQGLTLPCGLTADVDIETQRHHGVIKVPSQAVVGRPVDELPEEVRRRPEVDRGKTLATVVYRVVDGKAVVTPVKVGPSDATHTIIRAGLAEGDRVVSGPYKVLEGLSNEQRVKDNQEAARDKETGKDKDAGRDKDAGKSPATAPAPATAP